MCGSRFFAGESGSIILVHTFDVIAVVSSKCGTFEAYSGAGNVQEPLLLALSRTSLIFLEKTGLPCLT